MSTYYDTRRQPFDVMRDERNQYQAVARELELRLEAETERRLASEADLAAALRATNGIVPEYQKQDRFTICLLSDPLSERIFVGVARCNPSDKWSDTIGQAISLGRAIEQRTKLYCEQAFAR